MFEAWGRFVYRRRWPVLIASTILLALSISILAQGGKLVGGGPIDSTESGRALTLMRKELPQTRGGGSSFFIIFSSDSLRVADPAFREALTSAVEPLRSDRRISGVQTPYDGPGGMNPAAVSRDGHRALVTVSVTDEQRVSSDYYPELRELVRSDRLDVIGTGFLPINRDFNRTLEADLQRAEVVSLPLALLLLLLVFGTVVSAVLPLGVGLLAIAGGLAGTFLLSRVTDVSQYALNVVTLIGLGVAIDYSLFIVNRFREGLRAGASREDAVARAMATAGRAITFSGLTVAIGLAGMLFYQGTFLASLGLAGGVVVGFAVLYGLTFLPALLSLLGPRVNAWRLPLVGRDGSGSGLWHRFAMSVMRRPVIVLLPSLVFILFTGSPFLHLRLANADVDALPPQAESRRGYDILVKEFPGQDQNTITVVAHFPDGLTFERDRVGALYDLTRRIADIPDVLRIFGPLNLDPKLGRSDYQELYAGSREGLPDTARQIVDQATGEHILVISVLSAKPASTDDARAIVDAIRALPHPPGGELLVTGQTAFDIDAIRLILNDTPAAVAFVVLTTYLVLFLLLGSVFLPLKAVLMNFLSITASFGALVWIFQDGHLAEQLNFTPQSIDPTTPVIMFCIVFGLSMDYEVLLLSRVQEEYLRTRDNRRAVAEGLERSGRLITGAAAIMVAVFSAFALADVVIIKAIGLGMAVAVALDATLVRALIVPATMRLLGSLNWWAPGPLARLHVRLGLSESQRASAAAEATD